VHEIERTNVDPSVLLPRAHQFLEQLWHAVGEGLEGRFIVGNADLGLEGNELLHRVGDRRGSVHERIARKRCQDYFALLAVEALPAAEFAERRVGIPEPVVGLVRQVGFIGTEAQCGIRTALVEIAGDNAVLDQAAEQKTAAAWRQCEAAGNGPIRDRAKRNAGRHRTGCEGQTRFRQRETRNTREQVKRCNHGRAQAGCRHVAGDGKRDHTSKNDTFPRSKLIRAERQQIQRENGDGKQDVGQQ
jgi:hypothetical protein